MRLAQQGLGWRRAPRAAVPARGTLLSLHPAAGLGLSCHQEPSPPPHPASWNDLHGASWLRRGTPGSLVVDAGSACKAVRVM